MGTLKFIYEKNFIKIGKKVIDLEIDALKKN